MKSNLTMERVLDQNWQGAGAFLLIQSFFFWGLNHWVRFRSFWEKKNFQFSKFFCFLWVTTLYVVYLGGLSLFGAARQLYPREFKHCLWSWAPHPDDFLMVAEHCFSWASALSVVSLGDLSLFGAIGKLYSREFKRCLWPQAPHPDDFLVVAEHCGGFWRCLWMAEW